MDIQRSQPLSAYEHMDKFLFDYFNMNSLTKELVTMRAKTRISKYIYAFTLTRGTYNSIKVTEKAPPMTTKTRFRTTFPSPNN